MQPVTGLTAAPPLAALTLRATKGVPAVPCREEAVMTKCEERAAHVDDASTGATKFAQALLIVLALTGSLLAFSFVAQAVQDLSTIG